MLLTSLFIIIIYSSIHNRTNHFIKDINRIGILIIIYTLYILISSNIEILININNISIYNNIYKINLLSQSISIIILILSIILLFNSISSIINIKDIDIINYNIKNYIVIILFNLIGLLLFINVNNLIALYITIELQSYSLYILTSIYNKSNNALKSGLLYFLIGGIASIFILYGTAIIYYITGTLNLDNIYILTNYNLNIYIGIIMILLGFLLKMGMAPLHNWSINIYSNTPTIITMWISLIAKLSIMTLLFIILSNLSINNNNNILLYILSIFIILSFIIGSIGGLMQIKLKILLAYSGILNGGYLLYTILINNIDSLVAYIIYTLQYSLTHMNIFIIILLLPSIIYNNINNNNNLNNNNNNNNIYTSIYSPIEYINQLKLLININPFINLALIISIFSLIGIPPLFGFYGKLLIIISGLSNGYIYMTILLIICSTISTLYYIYIIKESSIYNNISINYNNINKGKYKYNLNLFINGNSISYIISIISLIILFNGVQIINIIKGAYIISISILNII